MKKQSAYWTKNSPSHWTYSQPKLDYWGEIELDSSLSYIAFKRHPNSADEKASFGSLSDAKRWVENDLHRLKEEPKSRMASKVSAWADVKAKGKRLLDSQNVMIDHYDSFYISAIVGGDNESYSTEITRKNAFGKRITYYNCTCPWGYWAYKGEFQYVGRLCSHALALFYKMQSMDYAIKRDKGLNLMSYTQRYSDNYDESDNLVSFLDWLEESDVDIEETPHSQIVGLAEMYCHDNDIDLEELVVDFFTNCVYDDENDEKYGKSMIEQVWTPGGVGNVVNAKTVDGEEYVHVQSELVDEWYHEDDIEPYRDENLDNEDEVDYLNETASSTIERNIATINAFGFNSPKTSGRIFTFEEQADLIDEDGVADQLSELDLKGTHYI